MTIGKREFQITLADSLVGYAQNTVFKKIDTATFTLKDYQNLLLMIFHQSYEGPTTFALAAGHCPSHHHVARDYLMHHADEEKLHWQWVINDLAGIGYAGPDPRTLFPKVATQAYIAFNVYTAVKFPVSRLAIAAVLESLGATYSKRYLMAICQQLKLKPNQTSFFLGHGDTDVGHTQDILHVLDKCGLSEVEWKHMIHTAKVAAELYRAMYEEAVCGEGV